MDQQIHVFVYGTLRKGERNHHLLSEATIIENNCWTNGHLVNTGRGFPAVVKDSQKKVIGELYKVNSKQLAALDKLEGFNGAGQQNHYERRVQQIFTENGCFNAFIYLYENGDDLESIDQNDWLLFIQR